MNKYFYVFFLALSSVHEISVIFEFPLNIFISLIYPLLLLYVLVIYIIGKLPSWVWVNGLSIVGIYSIVFILLSFIGLPKRPLEVMDAFVGLMVWTKSVNYLQKSDI
jgi:hypothetical protein